jgi:hypothetical protein
MGHNVCPYELLAAIFVTHSSHRTVNCALRLSKFHVSQVLLSKDPYKLAALVY